MYATNCIKPIQFSLMQLHIKNFPFLSFLYFLLFSYLVCFLIFQFVVNTFCSIPFCAKNFCYSKYLWFVIELLISPNLLSFSFPHYIPFQSVCSQISCNSTFFDFTNFSFYSKCNSYSYSWHVTQFYNFTLDLSSIPLSHSIPRCSPSSC